MFKAATVARPVGVRPRILLLSSLQQKCSCQSCRCGWNRGTRSPVSESWASTCAPLNSLQEWQATHRFSHAVWPPAASGMMWSITKRAPVMAVRVWQYAHWLWDSATTRWRRDRGMRLLVIRVFATLEGREHGAHAISTPCRREPLSVSEGGPVHPEYAGFLSPAP